MNKRQLLFIAIFITVLIPDLQVHAQDTLSLQGKWRITLDGNYKDWPVKMGIARGWFRQTLPPNNEISLLSDLYFKNSRYSINDWITLPGSTDEAVIGVPLVPQVGFSIGLERKTIYDGAFWVQKTITIPQNWTGKTVTLYIERVLGSSKVYWDGKYAGEDYGFAYAHEVIVDSVIAAGEHTITILVDKDDLRYQQYGHHIVNGNGASWNGIIGRIELIARNSTCSIKQVAVYPNLSKKNATLRIVLSKDPTESEKLVNIALRKKGAGPYVPVIQKRIESASITAVVPVLEPIAQWNEFAPNLYELQIEILANNQVLDKRIVHFGMREIGTAGGNITINGNKVFMRGTLDNGESPLTGYPEMTKEQWVKKLKTFKSYGVNLIRFHTWCPPEPAFIAADEVGMYLQPELCGAPYAELNRILDTYGNHPSFCMLSLNNEAFSHNELTRKLITEAKQKDPRHLYTCTTHPLRPECVDDFFVSAWGNHAIVGWPNFDNIVGITWGGGDNVSASRFNTMVPGTTFDYTSSLTGVPVPLISHEAGQWAMFPDFAEILKYTGALRNTNYERVQAAFLAHHTEQAALNFAQASGKFSALLYKEEIESALRTPGFGGIELLGLRDYPGQMTATVGIIDAFMDNKGLVSSEEHKKYCDAIVPLVRLEKRVFLTNEALSATVLVANFADSNLIPKTIEWRLVQKFSKNILKHGVIESRTIQKGMLTTLSQLGIPLNTISTPCQLELQVIIDAGRVENFWDIWVYPDAIQSGYEEISVVFGRSKEELKKKLERGESVLLLLKKEDMKDCRESCFAPVFWNSLFKWPQQSHTLGIYCKPEHPVFSDFPTDAHSNWQWWDIVMNAHAININKLPREFEPLVSVIDSYHLNNKLAYLFECTVGNGKLVVCTIDLETELNNRPASRQLKKSLLQYMGSSQFIPKQQLKLEQVLDLLRE